MSEFRVQFLVYFAYMNLQISFAFLMATYFSNVRTASGMLLLKCSHSCFVRWFQQIIYFHYAKLFCAVTGYLFTIGSGYLAEYLFRPIFEDMTLSSLCPNIPIFWLCLLLIYLIPLLLFLRKNYLLFLCFRKLDYTHGVLPTIFFVPHNLWVFSTTITILSYGLFWNTVGRLEWSQKWNERNSHHNGFWVGHVPFVNILFGRIRYPQKWNQKNGIGFSFKRGWEFSGFSKADYSASRIRVFSWNGQDRCFERGEPPYYL